jgi:class 3 adenylate cyclase
LDGLKAALGIQSKVADFNQESGYSPGLSLKLGLHIGPCIMYGSEGKIDYFGTTVNLAARVQNLSEGDDIVLSSEIANEESVQRFLTQLKIAPLWFETKVKGLSSEKKMCRLVLPKLPIVQKRLRIAR